MWDFFLSHVQRDMSAHALDMYHTLTSEPHQRRVWLDVKMERQDEAAMEEGVKNSKAIIAIFSESFPSSPYCRKELMWAIQYAKLVIPVIPSTMQSHIGRLVQKLLPQLRGIGTIEFIPLDRSKTERFEFGIAEVVHRAEHSTATVLRQPRQSIVDEMQHEEGGRSKRVLETLQAIANSRFLEEYDKVSDALKALGQLPTSLHALPDPKYKNLNTDDFPEPGYVPLNVEYPGVQAIHREPWIFLVNDFLTEEECGAALSKCYNGVLQRGWASAQLAGQADHGHARVCDSLGMPHQEAPNILAKYAKLFEMPAPHFEALQLIKYECGGRYTPHLDAAPRGEDGVDLFEPLGFPLDAQRVATVFVYLNDVARGGQTSFPDLNLHVTPKKGRALVFFPATELGVCDARLVHESKDAEETKVILATWLWSRPSRVTPSADRHESMYPMLSKLLI